MQVSTEAMPNWEDQKSIWNTHPKNNIAMENPPFEDAFSIENRDFPASHVSFQVG